MKKCNRSKREHGAVAIFSILIMTTLILITAMAVDYSLFYYKGAKLQNAVDSAATAVAAEIDATTFAQEQIARQYLSKNGFDGDSPDIDIDIEHKGVMDEDAYFEEGKYISTGYIKLTVDAKEGMIFSELLNRDSMRLIKTAYVKCDVTNYGNPQAIDYTLFAGSTQGTPANSALRINGRTGNTTNYLASQLEKFINGVNSSIVQPIIGLLGGQPDFNDLVHINLSEAITDGDVHSNSDISIGTQVVNVSRTKDGNMQTLKTDSDGNPIQKTDDYGNPVTVQKEVVKKDADGEPIKKTDPVTGEYLTDVDGNYIYETELKEEPVYLYENDNSAYRNNKPNDYGQVTYTAVKEITFTNTSLDDSTHVYTQNQQYLEQTQAALNILNNINLSNIESLAQLQNAYTEATNTYINAYSGLINDNQKEQIRNQKDNLSYDPSTKTVTLNNQFMIVYDVSQARAKQMLDMVVNADGEVSLDDLYNELNRNGNDAVYQADNSTLLFQNTADKSGTINYGITISSGNVEVKGTQVSRDIGNAGLSVTANPNDNKTVTGAKLSVVDTFQQLLGDEGYIPTPNLKPYFVREVNKSIRNATKTKEQLGDSERSGDRTVREAVRHLGDRLAELLNSTSYTDDKYQNYNETQTDDGTKYTASGGIKNNALDVLLEDYKLNNASGLTKLTGKDRTTFAGIELIKNINGETSLATPSDVIGSTPYAKTSTAQRIANFKTTDVYVDSDHARPTVTDYENHYGNEAVDKKKQWIINNISYNSVASRYDNFDTTAPAKSDVFLFGGSTPFANMTAAMNSARAIAEAGGSASDEPSTATVSDPLKDNFTIAPINDIGDVADQAVLPAINDTVTLGSTTYNIAETFLNGVCDHNTFNGYISAYGNSLSNSWSNNSNSSDELQRVNEDGSSAANRGSFHKPQCEYYKCDYHSARGFLVGPTPKNSKNNQAVWYTGYLMTGPVENKKLIVYDGAKVLIEGGQLHNNQALDIQDYCDFRTNTVLVCNGNVWNDKGVIFGENSIAIINGDLKVEQGNIEVRSGATLIVTGNVTAQNKAITVADNARLYVGGTVTYAGGSNNGKLTQGTGSTVAIYNNGGSGSTYLNYNTDVGSGATLYIKGTTYVWDALTVNGGKVYTEALRYYDGHNTLNITVQNNGIFYNTASINASYINAQGINIHTGAITSASTVTANTLYATGSVSASDINCSALHASGNVALTGTLSVTNNVYATGAVSATNITCANIHAAGISASGTIETSTIYSTGDVTANGINCSYLYSSGNVEASSIADSFVRIIVGGRLKINGNYTMPDEKPVQVGSFECTGAFTNNSKKFKILGSLNAGSLQNNGYIVTGTSLTTTGNLVNGAENNTDAVIFAYGQIIVGGDLTNYGRIGCLGGDGNGHSAIDVAGAAEGKDGSVFYTEFGGFKATDLTLGAGCEFNIKGDLNIPHSAVNKANMVIGGDFATKNFQNDAVVYCNGDLELEYLKVLENGIFAIDGNLTITSSSDGVSLDVRGQCYIDGNLTAAGTVAVDKGILYVNGDVSAANGASNGGNVLWVDNHCYVYIKGTLKSGVENRHIWIQEYAYDGTYVGHPTSTVVSVYGHGTASGYDPSELCNQQNGASIYLDASNGRKISFNGGGTAIQNNGYLYAYTDLEATGASTIYVSGNGKTYVKGNLTAANAVLQINGEGTAGINQHEFVAWGDVNVKSVKINNTQFYALKELHINSSAGTIEITNGSVFYAGDGSDFDMATATISSSTIYLPSGTGELVCGSNISEDCGIITNSDVRFTNTRTIRPGVIICVGGKATFGNDIDITNNGCLYLLGGVDLTNFKKYNAPKKYFAASMSNRTINKISCMNFGTNSDTYIGRATDKYESGEGVTGTLCFPATLIARGTLYIDNNLYAGEAMDFNEDIKEGVYVGNRRGAISVEDGHTYVSGNIVTSDNTGTLVNDNAGLSCGGDFTMGSTIYNYGKLIAYGSLRQSSTAARPTDRDAGNNMKEGYSIKNGNAEGDVNDLMFFGGNAGTDLTGYVVNFGKLYQNGALGIQGYTPYSGMERSTDCALVNRKNAQMYVNGNANMNSNCLFNDEGAKFHCQGTLDFGTAIANCNEVVVHGDIVQNQNSVNTHKYRLDTFTASILNGLRKAHGTEYKNAVLYCGGSINLGRDEAAGYAGSVMNFGTIYAGNDFNIYTNSGNSFFVTALWSFGQTKVIVGDNFFAGAGVATGNDSVFMCGKDFRSKRALKVNAVFGQTGDWQYTFYKRDDYKRAYFYVGENMMVNTLGKRLWRVTNSIPEDMSRAMIVHANTDMYVGGSFYANSDVKLGENCNMVVMGEGKRLNNNSTIEEIFTATDSPLLKAAVKARLSRNDYAFFVYQALDVSPCSNIIANGGAFVRDTAKIRDMTKTYFYGNFDCTDYVEIGKALDGVDETEAKEDLFKADGENNTEYKFSKAGYMFVGGDFVGQKYLKVYASTALRVLGDCTLQTKYVTLRHDASLYVGKKLKAATSIDVGSYSTVIVGGSMQATSSTIKIRDNVNCFVGGNMTALSYIELGKFGDYTRHIINMPSMSSFPNPNAANTTYKVGYLYHDNSNGNYYYWSQLKNSWQKSDYNGVAGGITDGGTIDECECCEDCINGPDCPCTCGKCKWHDGDIDASDAGADGSVEEGGDKQENYGSTTTVDTDAELSADDSDFAHGSTFYIGKTLATYTGYIKEFAYSQVNVGNYVFTPKYITLRHNADMWVMPETFNNSTYVKKSYVPKSDGTFWGDLKDRIGEFAFNVKETFTPKNGSIYTLGELTLNKNASLMGTWDCTVQGKCVLRQDSLIYMGHDFTLTAPSLNLSYDAVTGKESVCGFDTYGTSTGNTSFPVVVYADNEINIMTTIEMKLTYLVANRGNVKLYDIYSRSENAERNAKSLPNAICSYSAGIDYFSMYGKLGALFYCPNGHLDLDAYYLELWGCGIGDTVKVNTYYFAMHRFTNWSTMNLEMAQSGKVRLISQIEYDETEDNVDEIFMFDLANSMGTTDEEFVRQGASLFFKFDEDGNAITTSPTATE